MKLHFHLPHAFIITGKALKSNKIRIIKNQQLIESARDMTNAFFTPLDILDYIYAVLHSPHYRETYKEFLKTDFPRVPYPENPDDFWRLVKQGRELRQYHLLEHENLEKPIMLYQGAGDNTLLKPDYKDGRVYINATQYFDAVPQNVWEFWIGGYQPAQKWLKDRKGRILSFDDIRHYQRILSSIAATTTIMGDIDRNGL
jgi:predicted helicase